MTAMVDLVLNVLSFVWFLAAIVSAMWIIVVGFGNFFSEWNFRKMNNQKFFETWRVVSLLIALVILVSPNFIEFVGFERAVFNKSGEFLKTVEGPRFMLQKTYDSLYAENDVRSLEIFEQQATVYQDYTNGHFLKVSFFVDRGRILEVVKEAVRLGNKNGNEVNWLVKREFESVPSFEETLAKAISMNVKPSLHWDKPLLDETEASALFVPVAREAEKKLEKFGIRLSAPRYWRNEPAKK